MPAEDNNAARNGMLEKENREADRGTKGDASMDQTEVCQQVGRKIEGGKTDPRITPVRQRNTRACCAGNKEEQR